MITEDHNNQRLINTLSRGGLKGLVAKAQAIFTLVEGRRLIVLKQLDITCIILTLLK